MRSNRALLRGWLSLVLLVEAATALADAAFAPVSLAGLLLAGPLLAAHRLTARATALVTASAVVLAVVIPCPDTDSGSLPISDYAVLVLMVATGGLWATLTARARRRDERSLARMTHIAELTQQAIVHPLPARLADTCLAAHTRSAADQALIGGDLHDAIATPTGTRLIIGDVKGHGLEAVRLAAAVLNAFRQTAATEPDLVRLAQAIDGRIRPELSREDFVTVLLADFAPGQVRLVNCGHPSPLRIGHRLEILEPPRPSLPLGLHPEPHLHRIRLNRGQRLLLYTDGLTEAHNTQGDPFPLRSEHARNALTAPTLDAALQQLLDLLEDHAIDTGHDDLTLILAQPAPTSAATGAPGTTSAAERPANGR